MNLEEQFHGRVLMNILLQEFASSGLYWLLVIVLVFFGGIRVSEASRQPAMGNPIIGEPPQDTEDVFVPEPQDFTVKVLAEGLEIPWDLVFLPDGRMLLTERPGRIRLIREGRLEKEPYARLDVAHIGEGGLMGLAVHPGFPDQPYVYAMYTYRVGTDLFNKVVRLRDRGSTGVMDRLIAERIPGYRVHDGGRIAFGPDGMLYVCTGDVGKAEVAQDIENPGGKILRYKPDGSIPEDNPFEGSPLYAYGLRNPQGLAWHPETGDLFASDHGPSGEFGLFGLDSIKLIVRGGNHGWPLALGEVDLEPYVDPVVFWPRATPPAGMTFFRGDLYVTSLRGEALIRIKLLREDGSYEAASIERLFASEWFRGKYGRLRHAVAGPDGNLYVLTSNLDGRGRVREGDDKVLKLIPR